MTPFAHTCDECHNAPVDPAEVAVRVLRLFGVNLGPIVCGGCFDHMSREFCKEAMA